MNWESQAGLMFALLVVEMLKVRGVIYDFSTGRQTIIFARN